MNNLADTYEFYYWGPLLWRSKIPLEFCDELLVRGQQLSTPMNNHLASIIDDVKEYSSRHDRKFLVDNLHAYLQRYMEFASKWYRKDNANLPELELMKFWINFQKNDEYNPEHTHTGDLSFVIYLDMPSALQEENVAYTGTRSGPGSIVFRYGEDNDWAASMHTFLPAKGDIFIFPAKLAHTVFPFKSVGTRISVSGNFKYVKD